MNYLDELENEVTKLAKDLEAPEYLIPTFTSSRQDGTPHIEVTGKEYHFVVCERGNEFVALPKNRAIGLVKNETIKLTKTNEKNKKKIHR